MPARRMLVIALMVMFARQAHAAQRSLNSAELLSLYSGIFTITPSSDIDSIKSRLREQGFASSDEVWWTHDDEVGRLILRAFFDISSFELDFIPKAPGPFGDAALAALISRSAGVALEDGQTISVALYSRAIEGGGKHGTTSEFLKFNLRGGVWTETQVFVTWDK
jgi:hypothetical protein